MHFEEFVAGAGVVVAVSWPPCRTQRYVGNLDHSVSEDLLCALFSQIGNVRGCKVIREKRTRSQTILAQASARCARVAKSARAHPRGSELYGQNVSRRWFQIVTTSQSYLANGTKHKEVNKYDDSSER
ncbi:nucleolysin TIAR-like isoform X1 [Diprion similis]|uniref:nucleolysin TIAR-like isoform X1 n=1 Tax=Diprion similis TaxID=362088 RepID=UPI001EF85ECE|nr:nucleolysin TIAR-like isoform X1 [Diprion similis]